MITIDIPEIERLTKEFAAQLKAITGFEPDVDVWFHMTRGNTRALAHDAITCGYKTIGFRRSHIAVVKEIPHVGTIRIHVQPRKVAQ